MNGLFGMQLSLLMLCCCLSSSATCGVYLILPGSKANLVKAHILLFGLSDDGSYVLGLVHFILQQLYIYSETSTAGSFMRAKAEQTDMAT